MSPKKTHKWPTAHEKMQISPPAIRNMQISATILYHYTSARLDTIRNTDN